MAWMALALIVAAGLTAAAFASLKRRGASGPPPQAEPPVTVLEQPMYWRLQERVPGHMGLAQVAFSTLLTARGASPRDTFGAQAADFVVCTRGLRVLAAADRDGAGHAVTADQDAQRQLQLEQAGYTVLRFKHLPSPADLRSAMAATCAPRAPGRAGDPARPHGPAANASAG